MLSGFGYGEKSIPYKCAAVGNSLKPQSLALCVLLQMFQVQNLVDELKFHKPGIAKTKQNPN